MVIQRFRPSFGGQGIQLESLCSAMLERGIEPTVYTANPGAAPARETLDGYRVRRVPSSLGPFRPCWPAFGVRVHRELQRESPDLVHVHGLTDALYGSWLFCRRRHRPLVYEMTLLGADEPSALDANPARARWLRRRIYRRADAYVAMSRAFEPDYSASGLPPERFHVIPQGVDTRRFAPATPEARVAARAALGLPRDAPAVLFTGSLIARKGIDIVLGSWRLIRARHPRAVLLLAGPGPLPESAASTLAELSEEDRASVHQLGRRDDLPTVTAAADVFVFPSRREGFGTVIIEAMAAGLPCVVASLAGITDYIFEAPASGIDEVDDATDGIVVEQERPDQVAASVAGLLSRPQAAALVGERARRRAVEAFELGTVADRYVDLYRALQGAPR